MKVFAYISDDDNLSSLKEVSIQANADELRHVAEFLMHSAQLIESHGRAFGHEHYKDYVKDKSVAGCDIIVVNSGNDPVLNP